MRIAALLNVHEDSSVMHDTLDSIRTYMTEDILVLTDGASYYNIKELKDNNRILVRSNPFQNLPVSRIEGFYHGCNKSPFRNMTLGLKTISENWDADWYCYIEYDCLVGSSDFKEDLEEMEKKGVWLVGNDVRQGNYQLPFIESIVGDIKGCFVVLGCCVFFHRDFMKAMKESDFFNKFLCITNSFRETVPTFDKQGAYDFGEVLYPTLAAHYGGKVEEFARFNDMVGWTGNAERYPMRFRPDINDEFPEASIIHPIKNYNHPFREYHREKRKRYKKGK